MRVVATPDLQDKNLAELCTALDELLHGYKNELLSSAKAQENLIEFLSLFCKVHVNEDFSFQAHFQILVDKEISLFNIYYLKQVCRKFPEDVW